MKKARKPPWPLIMLAILCAITAGSGVLLFGPSAALHIGLAASTNVLIDGLAEDPGPHRIMVVDLKVDPAALDSLNADLPWSGNDAKRAVLTDNGITYKASYRYRGLVAGTHYLGGKKSFRLNLKKDNPFAPYRRLNFLNPKANNFLNQHLAYRIGASMGVAVPYSDLAFVRLNGRDHGVHHVVEQIDGDFERNRHLIDRDVPVFKGDNPPAVGRNWPESRYLWVDAHHWSYTSDADSTEAWEKLARLVKLVGSPSIDDSSRMAGIAALIEVDAFVRYYAVQLVLRSTHADNVHNQWLVLSPRSGKFYPVLWDALLLFSRTDPFYPIHDVMEFHLMKDPALRLRRDRYVMEAIREWEEDGGFDHALDVEAERALPSVLCDRNKYGEVTGRAQDVLRYSALHWAGSCDRLRAGVHDYWRKLDERMRIPTVQVMREADELLVRWNSDGTLGYELDADTLRATPVGIPFTSEKKVDDPSVRILPLYRVRHSMGDKPRMIKNGENWIAPHELRIRLNGTDPSRIHFINLTTDEPVAVAH